MRSIIILLVLCTASTTILAQQTPRSLKIGDKVPDIELSNIYNYSSNTARLSDFNEKVLILDFWATTCFSCLKNFPVLDSLQSSLPDRLQILLINSKSTGDSKQKIIGFLDKKRRHDGTKFNLPTLINDTIFANFFKHRLIPHYVWIYQGTVKAITAGDEITSENINRLLQKEPSGLSTKKDMDTNLPLFASADISTANLVHYSVLTKGKYNGLSRGNRYRREQGVVYGRAIANTPLLDLFRIAMQEVYPQLARNRFYMSVADKTPFVVPVQVNQKNNWYKENSYTYELIVPINEAGKLYEYMLEDLNRYSAYTGKPGMINTKCYILINTGNSPHAGASEATTEQLMKKLNGLDFIIFPVINEAAAIPTDLISIDKDITDLHQLKRKLNQYGLDLVEGKRELEMFILADKK